MAENILRLPISDRKDDFALVSVASSGPHPLDVTLVATDGEYVYSREPRQSTSAPGLFQGLDLTESNSETEQDQTVSGVKLPGQ